MLQLAAGGLLATLGIVGNCALDGDNLALTPVVQFSQAIGHCASRLLLFRDRHPINFVE